MAYLCWYTKFRGDESDRAQAKAGRKFVAELISQNPASSAPKACVFVDGRTELSRAKCTRNEPLMMPNCSSASPVAALRADGGIEAFGSFIHTYKFDEIGGRGGTRPALQKLMISFQELKRC